MNRIRWYHILGVMVGIIAVFAIVYWIVRTTGLLSRSNHEPQEQLTENN